MSSLYNDDCLNVLKGIPDHSVDLCVTDPPYVIDTAGAGIYKRDDKRYVKDLADIKDGFSTEILDELCRVMKRINIYLFCSRDQIIPLLDYFVKGKGCNYVPMSWHKINPIPACGNKYLSDTEYILFFRESGVPLYGTFETKLTYYVTPLNTKDKELYGHPTVKPLHIIKNLIINSSMKGDTVIDPFMGSGTTCAAAKMLGREYIGIEKVPEYYRTACERVSKARQDGAGLDGWL